MTSPYLFPVKLVEPIAVLILIPSLLVIVRMAIVLAASLGLAAVVINVVRHGVRRRHVCIFVLVRQRGRTFDGFAALFAFLGGRRRGRGSRWRRRSINGTSRLLSRLL